MDDGGSRDGTWVQCRGRAAEMLQAPRGRSSQMNAGAALAQGDVLLFLHADVRLPGNAAIAIEQAIATGAHWGCFDVKIVGRSVMFPVITALMNLRSHLFHPSE